MPSLRFELPQPVIEMPDWNGLREELQISDRLTGDVLAAADIAASKALPRVEDCRSMPFFTIDPEGSRDLDQAMFLERSSAGYVVNYAIADVAHFVEDGDVLDLRAHQLGQTFYGPDKKVPLYPFAISEGAGSLLPGEDRPAVLWKIVLDSAGEMSSVTVRRALVRSRTQLSYEVNGGDPEQMTLLQEIGTLRQQIARSRDAVDLPSPEQLVEDGPAGPSLSYRQTTPVEMWNSQISLLTGMAAAKLMIDGKIGVLRTLPSADAEAIKSLRLSADALGIEWPKDASYGDVISGIDSSGSNAPAFLNLAARMLRGAAYVSFDGSLPEHLIHSGVGASYAHCTAPLRRLIDRYVSEICIALSADSPVPGWVRDHLAQLPKQMSSSDQKAHALNRAVIEAAEAFVMSSCVGQEFDAVVVEKYEGAKQGTVSVQLADPAVRATCRVESTDVQLGAHVRVRCTEADIRNRTTGFVLVARSETP